MHLRRDVSGTQVAMLLKMDQKEAFLEEGSDFGSRNFGFFERTGLWDLQP